jgi:hypothetical protein
MSLNISGSCYKVGKKGLGGTSDVVEIVTNAGFVLNGLLGTSGCEEECEDSGSGEFGSVVGPQYWREE